MDVCAQGTELHPELATEKTAHVKTEPSNSNSVVHILGKKKIFFCFGLNAHLNILLLWDTEKVLMSKSHRIRYALGPALENVKA